MREIKGFYETEIPELGPPFLKGKVRDIWRFSKGNSYYLAIVTTDRQSAFDKVVATVPKKGKVLNLTSAFWFKKTADVVPNHLIVIPHPNVSIVKEARQVLPVEVIIRKFLARSSTSTSVYHNYFERGRRDIYGIKFPDGLLANQEFPMGAIITPTTKSKDGHDEELAGGAAQIITDKTLGVGMWEKVSKAAFSVFEAASEYSLSRGLILADSKYEFGIDQFGKLMLIDDVDTPDSSRYWLKTSYEEKVKNGENPESFDKEILRRYLSEEKKFKGVGEIPDIDDLVINKMSQVYESAYTMITGNILPDTNTSIKSAILQFIESLS